MRLEKHAPFSSTEGATNRKKKNGRDKPGRSEIIGYSAISDGN